MQQEDSRGVLGSQAGVVGSDRRGYRAAFSQKSRRLPGALQAEGRARVKAGRFERRGFQELHIGKGGRGERPEATRLPRPGPGL